MLASYARARTHTKTCTYNIFAVRNHSFVESTAKYHTSFMHEAWVNVWVGLGPGFDSIS
jgi:hypothetical protein